MIYNGDNFSFIYDNYYINYFIETAINNNKKLIKIKGGAYTNERLTRKNINKTINKYTRKLLEYELEDKNFKIEHYEYKINRTNHSFIYFLFFR